ncbi:MAG: beta-N-acetylhexosaminidase [Burkholderiales bacterium]|jgi:beta-N-acetylhexosaminidase|nr:beta-N-acetylhexosaminidase [Burkholderiales bacterium]
MAERALGPVMVDVAGLTLSAEERDLLAHPLVGGVILFQRNYHSPEQLGLLTAEIRAARDPALLIAADHEGGRVQRFREGFTRIPPMAEIGRVHDAKPALAEHLARAAGVVIGSELLAAGVDFSFTPVLDVDFGSSSVIGDRAFHADPEVVARLATQLALGLAAVGVAAVGKHFPGHGFVRADSHTEVPIDERDMAEIAAKDLLPYRSLISAGLGGVMPAHVIYPKVDPRPAGFSPVWLKDVLRRDLAFDGMIFSDDLSMEGASVAGDVVARAHAAFDAGCDMVLVCNAPDEAAKLLDRLSPVPLDAARVLRMRGGGRSEADYGLARSELVQAFPAATLA